MFRLIFPLILTLFLGVRAGTVLEKLAIMNGPIAPEGQFPYQIEIQSTIDGSHLCGGSIINERYILTAAHCIYDNPDEDSSTSNPDDYDYDYESSSTETPDDQSFDLENSSTMSSDYEEFYGYYGLVDPKDIQILVGVNKLDDEHGIIYKVEEIIMHENYKTDPLVPNTADVALIRVTEDIEFNDKVQPVNLASSKYPEDLLLEGAPVVVTGWGYTYKCMEDHEQEPNELRIAKMTIYDFKKCQLKYLKEYYKEYNESNSAELIESGVDRGMICSIGLHHTCMGDSGGPIVDERGVQVGIVSYGIMGLPDVNVNVRYYSEWIANHSRVTKN